MTGLVIAAASGFLLAVLWFDLMFDAQVRGHQGEQLPETVLASIAAYYRRVTTTASPMGFLVAAVMATLLIALGLQASDASRSTVARFLPLSLGAGAVALGLLRTFPNAIRLGARKDTVAAQSALARSIAREHLFCFCCVLSLLILQASSYR